MEEYVKDATDASQDEEIIGLYDKEAHLEMLRLSEIEEAKEKGIEQGITQGIEQEKLEIAKNMLQDNIDSKTISKYTGLTKEQIESLK